MDTPRKRVRSFWSMLSKSWPSTSQLPESWLRIAAMTEIKVVFPHPDGPTSMSNSPRRTSTSMPRSAITLASPVPYVFVKPRQWTANSALGPAASMAYSMVCPSVLLEERTFLSEAQLPSCSPEWSLRLTPSWTMWCSWSEHRPDRLQQEQLAKTRERLVPEVYPQSLVRLQSETTTGGSVVSGRIDLSAVLDSEVKRRTS